MASPSLGVVPGETTLAYEPPAAAVRIGSCRAIAGTSSWADRSLVNDGSFYPSQSLTAGERLSYYAHRLPLTEVATSYRFPPTPEVSKRWVANTPAGFTMDVRAWSLLSGAPTWPESLWQDLHGYVRPPRREGAKLYKAHLPADVVDECWARFGHALRPLRDAGRLGTVTFRYPSWFTPRAAAYEELAALPARMAGYRTTVELTSERWFERDTCEGTLELLEDLGLSLLVQASPRPAGQPRRRPVVAATSDIAVVRFSGRSWEEGRPWGPPEPPAQSPPGDAGPAEAHLAETGPAEVRLGESSSAAAWWSYRYSDEELQEWAPAIRELASCTSEVHVVMDNSWKCDAVDNAAKLLELLAD